MKGRLLNEQNTMANFEPFKCIELFFVPWQVTYKYCDKSFISKPTFFYFCASVNKENVSRKHNVIS